MRVYKYGGRTFATIAAASTYHGMRDWFAGSKQSRRSKPKPNKSVSTPKRVFNSVSISSEQNNMHEDTQVGTKKTQVYINTGLPPLRRVLKNKILYRDEFWNTVSWNGNEEKFIIPWYVGTSSQYLSTTNNVAVTNRDQVSYGAFLDLNPLQGVATGTLTSSSIQPSSDWIGISDSIVYMDFMNASTIACYMKIHYFVATADTDEDILQCYAQACDRENLYSNSFVFPNTNIIPVNSGNEDAFNVVASATDPAVMVVLPYTNLLSKRNVKANWRKLKTKSYIMAGGDALRVTTHIKNNQFGMREKLNSQPSIFPKGCVCCLIETQGAAVIDSTPLAPQTGSATYAAGQITFCTTRKINLSTMAAPNARFNSTYVGAGRIQSNSTIQNQTSINNNDTIAKVGNDIV